MLFGTTRVHNLGRNAVGRHPVALGRARNDSDNKKSKLISAAAALSDAIRSQYLFSAPRGPFVIVAVVPEVTPETPSIVRLD